MTLKVGIFDPYLDTLGGGERYMMTIAKCLAEQGHQVDVFWDDKRIKERIEKRLGINLEKIKFIEDIFYPKKNLFKKWKFTHQYDIIFYLSDGSIPTLFAKKNILHFQVPFTGVKGKSVLNKIKLKQFSHIICNSYFTKKNIDQEYNVKSRVIYPPVAVEDFQSTKKENIILGVGRFSKTLHAKKQDILIDGFKRIYEISLNRWKLILIGGAQDEDKNYIEELKKKATGFPIEILINVDFSTLQRFYGKAKIFWHAAGFGEDEERNPEKMEHFGIVVVEAMAAGCVPIVIGKGGIPEIVTNKVNGFLWKTQKELVKQTIQLAKSPKIMRKMSLQGIESSKKFSKKVFCQKIDEVIKN